VTRAAAIDIGTNSTRLLVADFDGRRIDDLVRRTVVTRLARPS
jgi:exopolyphosphatase/pppGpp-phosphohydrolase